MEDIEPVLIFNSPFVDWFLAIFTILRHASLKKAVLINVMQMSGQTSRVKIMGRKKKTQRMLHRLCRLIFVVSISSALTARLSTLPAKRYIFSRRQRFISTV